MAILGAERVRGEPGVNSSPPHRRMLAQVAILGGVWNLLLKGCANSSRLHRRTVGEIVILGGVSYLQRLSPSQGMCDAGGGVATAMVRERVKASGGWALGAGGVNVSFGRRRTVHMV